jgi:hypothetical protein
MSGTSLASLLTGQGIGGLAVYPGKVPSGRCVLPHHSTMAQHGFCGCVDPELSFVWGEKTPPRWARGGASLSDCHDTRLGYQADHYPTVLRRLNDRSAALGTSLASILTGQGKGRPGIFPAEYARPSDSHEPPRRIKDHTLGRALNHRHSRSTY